MEEDGEDQPGGEEELGELPQEGQDQESPVEEVILEMAKMDMVREQPGEDQGQEVIREQETSPGEQEAIDTLTGGFGEPQEAEGTLPGRESELQEVDLKEKGKLVETEVMNQEPGGQGKRRVKHTSMNGRGQPGTEKAHGELSQVPEVSIPELPPV